VTRACLLDALGTLVRLEPPAPALVVELRSRFGVSVTLEEAERAIAAEIAYYRAHLDEGRDQAGVMALRGRCARVIADELPVVGQVGLSALTDALLASLRFTVFDDVRGALVALRGGGARLVVASNWDVSLHEVLERLGVAALVDGIVTSAEVGARKPAPAVFERALVVAGVAASEAVHVGDSVVEDVAGARAAGVTPVLLRRDGAAGPNGVRTIASLRTLVDLAPPWSQM
jgi:putative hydrolase of the HAD superfamily